MCILDLRSLDSKVHRQSVSLQRVFFYTCIVEPHSFILHHSIYKGCYSVNNCIKQKSIHSSDLCTSTVDEDVHSTKQLHSFLSCRSTDTSITEIQW